MVRQIVDQTPQPITAVEISKGTGFKVGTCRACLSRLARKRLIKKQSYGYYTSLFYDVMRHSRMVPASLGDLTTLKYVEPRLHCLRLRVLDVKGNPEKWQLDLDLIKVKFQTYRNGRAQVFIDCKKEYSLDYPAYKLLVELVLREVGQKEWDKVRAISYEYNLDYPGLKLDGVRAVTLTAFDGSFRRVYNKRHGLRDEVKIVGSVQADKVLSLLKGDATYSATQFLSEAIADMRQTEVIVLEAVQSMKRLADAVVKRLNKLEAQSK